MELLSVVLPFIFLHLLIQECQGVLILNKNELSTYSSSAEGADEPFYVNLTCRFLYADYTTAPYLTITWTDVTNSFNILDVANIVQNGSVNAKGEYINVNITRLSTAETDGSIRLEIPEKTAKFKIFNCEVSALSDTPSIYSRPVFAYDIACENGRYGPDCSSECGNCKDDLPCNKNNGYCPNGCKDGFSSPLCKACENGRYGPDCSSECGNCKDDLPCNKNTGYCLNECKDGFYAPRCKVCTSGRYGVNCSMLCGQCLFQSDCDKTTGVCRHDCTGGFSRPMCFECVHGYYGDSCLDKCGHCLDSSPCDKSNGTCPDGCDPGFKSDLCNIETEAVPCHPAVYIVAVAVLAVLCFVLFVTTVVFLVKSRRLSRQEQVKARHDNYQVKGDGKERPKGEPEYREMR